MVSPACTAGLFCIAAGAVDRCHIHHMWECLLQRVLPAGRSARARERVGRAGSVTRKLYTKVIFLYRVQATTAAALEFGHILKSSGQVKWNPSVISAHSLPPLLAAGAHSIGFRMVVCCLCIDLT